jgi:serine/threonine protein kinase
MQQSMKVFDRKSLKLLTQLKEGGQSRVYSARRLVEEPGKMLAIKLFGPDFHHAFHQEKAVLSTISHPSLPCLKGVIEDRQGVGLVFDMLSGKTLGEAFALGRSAQKQMNFRAVRHVAVGLFSALAYLHTVIPQRVIHGDVSPDNIFLDDTGIITLIDFGASVFLCDAHHTRLAFGKSRYMAPEQLQSGIVSFQADLFSCAAVLFELITLEHFRCENSSLQLRKLEHHLRAFDETLGLVLKGCLAPTPWLRPCDAGVVVKLLKP